MAPRRRRKDRLGRATDVEGGRGKIRFRSDKIRGESDGMKRLELKRNSPIFSYVLIGMEVRRHQFNPAEEYWAFSVFTRPPKVAKAMFVGLRLRYLTRLWKYQSCPEQMFL